MEAYLRLSIVHVSNVHADHPVAALCLFKRTAASSSSFFPFWGTGTPRESRYAFRRVSLHVPIAELNRSSALSAASSVARAYALPAELVAAPKAEAPDELAPEAALLAE
jgi:hypothetical protein